SQRSSSLTVSLPLNFTLLLCLLVDDLLSPPLLASNGLTLFMQKMKKAASSDSLPTPHTPRSSSLDADLRTSDASFRRSSSQVTPSSSRAQKKKKKKKKNHNNPLVDSFRDFLEELPEQKNRKQTQRPPKDEVGEAMTEILNSDPRFSCPHGDGVFALQHKGRESAAAATTDFRPLLSVQNWKRLQAVLFYVKHAVLHCDPINDVPAIFKSIHRYMFWSTTASVSGFLLAFVGLSLVFLGGLAAATAFVTVWLWRFGSLVGMLVVSSLVDWNDISKLLPSIIVNSVCKVAKAFTWIDRIILQGKRYRGREWNKDDFEVDHPANTAQSSYQQQYLWKLPPPTIEKVGHEHCADVQHLQRPEWGKDTVEHVAAIDFCYLVMREEFVQSKFRKLRKAVFKKSQSDVNGLEDDGCDTKSILSKRSHSFDDELLYELENSINAAKAIDIDTPRNRADTSPDPKTPIDKEISMRLLDILETDDDEDGDESQGLSRNHSREDSLTSGSDVGKDMNWMDVGAEIGIKILGSAAVQKAMTSHDTAEKINTLKDKVENRMTAIENRSFDFDDSMGRGSADIMDERSGETKNLPPAKPNTMSLPMHSMWTSAAAAVPFSSSADTLEGHGSQIISQPFFELKPSDEALDEILDTSPTFDTPAEQAEKIENDASQRSSCTKNGIEMICDTADYRKISIKSQTPKNDILRRPLLLPGVKIVVPIYPLQPASSASAKSKSTKSKFQMGTVVACKRLSSD
ncbi:MAG: hypothetical protein SGILL_004324, partial [Bacillariaceae sp.]